MVKPAPYPITDSAEQDAVNTFRSLIDSWLVKDDIRTRDKYPNIDGTLELVNQEQYPIGKLEVQVRKIGTGATKYSCPMSLVAYSKVSTLPVLMVCVDVENKRAFWRQISIYMPEYKDGQKSFTIYFDEISNAINNTGIYLQKWQEIVSDYQQRITKYPLISEVAEKITFDDIELKDREFCQRYIDTVNTFLDQHFPTLKILLFPGVWKLGMGIHTADEQGISYRIYRIPYGDSQPLISRFRGKLFDSERFHASDVSRNWTQRKSIKSPEIEGQKFVFHEVKKIFKSRSFFVKGILLSSDILISFIDKYANCLGISPDSDKFSVTELNCAFNQYLLGICATIAALLQKRGSHFLHLDLDWVSTYLRTNKVIPTELKGNPVRFSLGSKKIPLKNVFDSIQYLLANNIPDIYRPFARFNPKLVTGAAWIWSGYTYEDEVGSVAGILNQSIDQYKQFVDVNKLSFQNSPYLDPNTSVIFEYFPTKFFDDGPELREFHIENPSRQFPKLTVFINTSENKHWDILKRPDSFYVIEGNQYKIKYRCDSGADFFFHETPVQSLLYRMLAHDLGKNYQISDIGIWG